jgi:hypothetical protein
MWLQRSIRRRPGPGPGPGHLQLQQQPERNGGGGSGRVRVPLAAARGVGLRPPGGGDPLAARRLPPDARQPGCSRGAHCCSFSVSPRPCPSNPNSEGDC